MASSSSSGFWSLYGYDFLLCTIAAFYVITVPYTKVEESFNVQVCLFLSHYACVLVLGGEDSVGK